MSVLVRSAIEKNLAKVKEQLADTSSNSTADISAEIKELETSMNSIKSPTAKKAIQKEIDALSKKLTVKKAPPIHVQYKAELKSLEDGYTKILAVMANIPFYMSSTKGAKKGSKKK